MDRFSETTERRRELRLQQRRECERQHSTKESAEQREITAEQEERERDKSLLMLATERTRQSPESRTEEPAKRRETRLRRRRACANPG